MPEPCCAGCYDTTFDDRKARAELRRYRQRGPTRQTLALAEALGRRGVTGRTVLDIGAGVGALHYLLLERGAVAATDVDASGPYLGAAREEAGRRGLSDRVSYLYGDVVSLAPEVPAADLVGLDRVVCCYRDMDALVTLAAERTRRRLGIVLPPDGFAARFVIGASNAWYRLIRSPYRAYAHPHERVAAAARAGGLEPAGSTSVGMWHLLVFERPILTADSR
ncbi:MAG: class I SAM-dependent methyltransferase [Candidatus Limnocylindrales bacterium]